tara:strand:+ start:41 stop:325 length:285 start_codon:yes stop_codon:yes gene_type:complete
MEITKKEETLLLTISNCSYRDEQGYSEFCNDDVKTKSRAGILSSLIKKGLVFDSYMNNDGSKSIINGSELSMYVITENGIDSLQNAGHKVESFI